MDNTSTEREERALALDIAEYFVWADPQVENWHDIEAKLDWGYELKSVVTNREKACKYKVGNMEIFIQYDVEKGRINITLKPYLSSHDWGWNEKAQELIATEDTDLHHCVIFRSLQVINVKDKSFLANNDKTNEKQWKRENEVY